MNEFTVNITINAPAARCFDLARSIDFHQHSMRATGERIVSGRSTGLIELHESVEFEGSHLGMTRRLEAEICEYERPRRFADRQKDGPFKSLHHEHVFEKLEGSLTQMTDHIQFEVGWSVLGEAVGKILVLPHLRRLLTQHQKHLKDALEGNEWKQFLKE